MKITKGKLRQIIREEVSRVLSEQNEKDYAKQIGSADQMDVARRIALAMLPAIVSPKIRKPVDQHIDTAALHSAAFKNPDASFKERIENLLKVPGDPSLAHDELYKIATGDCDDEDAKKCAKTVRSRIPVWSSEGSTASSLNLGAMRKMGRMLGTNPASGGAVKSPADMIVFYGHMIDDTGKEFDKKSADEKRKDAYATIGL